MQTTTAPAAQATDAPATRTAHMGCPWCTGTPAPGDVVTSLCGWTTIFVPATSAQPDCLVCADMAPLVLVDGACRRCP